MNEKKNEIILFENQGVKLEVNLKDETVWLNRQQLAELFGRDIKTIGKHINNALNEELQDDNSVVAKFATTASDGKTQRVYTIEGNTSNSCAQRDYDMNSEDILGYGRPNYSDVVANYNYENVVAQDLENYILTMQNSNTL